MMRKLVEDLHALGQVEAPNSLLPSVMAEIGLGDSYAAFDAPIGRCYVAYNHLGVSAVLKAESDAEFERAFRARFGRPARPARELPTTLRHALNEWTHDSLRTRLDFDLRGLSEFEQAVLRKALEIPPGEVRPYAWIAREIGKPGAVRAVGSALGDNPIPLLIPCHRVVKSDGSVGNYGFGPAAKRTVLAQEGIDPDALDRMARSGVRYFGSNTTHIFCFPTCRHARRVTDLHRVVFHSESEAVASGYRPCKVCRPAAIAAG
jgi:O-6-methylguanine DNA methyltransferase